MGLVDSFLTFLPAGTPSDYCRNEVMQLRAIVKKSEIEREEVSDFLKEVQRTSAENEAAFDQQLKSLLSEKQQMLNQVRCNRSGAGFRVSCQGSSTCSAN